MKILVCGGRDFQDYNEMSNILNTVNWKTPISCVVHGDARGADRMSAKWAKENNIDAEPYPALWDVHGRAAGPIRNKLMLDDNPDIELVIAFKGGRGTRNMINQSKQKSVKVIEV